MTFHVGVWPSLDPRSYLWRKKPLPFPLAQQTCEMFALGRHALWNAVRALGLAPGHKVLVPSLHHGSEVEALTRAGLECSFYALNEKWEPDKDNLDDLIDEDVRALHLIHYLGFPQDLARWRRWCDERGLFLIEDAAQSFQASYRGKPVGSFGDAAIFCLYKTYGLPDGAAAVVRRAPPFLRAPEARASLGPVKLVLRHGAWMGQYSRSISAIQRAIRHSDSTRPPEHDDEREFALGDPSSPPSVPTSFLLPRVVDERTPARRRDHYDVLLKAMGDLVVPAFRELHEGASPFAFPIETARPDDAVRRLRNRDVNAIRFWTFPHPSFPSGAFPQADFVRNSTIVLPVHQELKEASVERVIDEVRRVVKH